jgi:alpha-galactosidase
LPNLRTIDVDSGELGFKGSDKARDIWAAKDLGTVPSNYVARVRGHGVVLLKVK